MRLSLGYSAFFLAAACFAWDYKLGHDRTKYWTASAVFLYVVLNAAMTGWMQFVEKGVVYEGVAPSGETVYTTSVVFEHPPMLTTTKDKHRHLNKEVRPNLLLNCQDSDRNNNLLPPLQLLV